MNSKTITLIIFIFLNLTCIAQYKISPQPLSLEIVKQHSISFNLNDKDSKGYQFLESLVANNDYMVIGEYHFSENIQLLSTELCDIGSKYGYTDFICESGRYSMQFLNKIINDNNNIQEALTAYFKPNKFVSRSGGESEVFNPIAFLTTKQEVQLLNKIKEKNYTLHGIDQEFMFSAKMFVNELAKRKNTPADKIAEVYQHLDSLEKRTVESGFNYCRNLLADSLIVNYLSSHQTDNWNNIFKTWKESMGIYFGRRRNMRRVSLMRQNFIEQISPRFEANSDLKFIMKLGAFHTPRGIADLGLYDIGDLVAETAKQFHKRAIHIRCRSRYSLEENEIYDSCSEEANADDNLFEKLGKKDRWVIIDLRPLKASYLRNEISIPETLVNSDIKSTIENNDILIITPLDRSLIEL